MEPDCMYEYRYDRSELFIEESSYYTLEDDDEEIGFCESCGDCVDEFDLEDGLCPYCQMLEEDEDELDED